MLKFGDKSKPPFKIDLNPLQVKKANLLKHMEFMKVDAAKDPNPRAEELNMVVQQIYPKAKEELINFPNRCNIKGSEVMMCPCFSAIFKKEATKDFKKVNLQQLRKDPRVDRKLKITWKFLEGEFLLGV